mmetsp:Transcript_8399/g.15748  ORF Transcript_8399/g.15748 Transcript_8399/m.15748 type:complete len:213 (+) Transcript_8399:52-690(+)
MLKAGGMCDLVRSLARDHPWATVGMGTSAAIAFMYWKGKPDEIRPLSKLPTLTPRIFGGPLEGTSKKVMVLMAGYPDSHEMWTEQVKEFQADYTMISITTPDFDQPALRSEWGYTPGESAAMVEACIEANVPKGVKFDLVAHDWGSYWAWIYAARHMERLRKFVTIDVGASVHQGGVLKETCLGKSCPCPTKSRLGSSSGSASGSIQVLLRR